MAHRRRACARYALIAARRLPGNTNTRRARRARAVADDGPCVGALAELRPRRAGGPGEPAVTSTSLCCAPTVRQPPRRSRLARARAADLRRTPRRSAATLNGRRVLLGAASSPHPPRKRGIASRRGRSESSPRLNHLAAHPAAADFRPPIQHRGRDARARAGARSLRCGVTAGAARIAEGFAPSRRVADPCQASAPIACVSPATLEGSSPTSTPRGSCFSRRARAYDASPRATCSFASLTGSPRSIHAALSTPHTTTSFGVFEGEQSASRGDRDQREPPADEYAVWLTG